MAPVRRTKVRAASTPAPATACHSRSGELSRSRRVALAFLAAAALGVGIFLLRGRSSSSGSEAKGFPPGKRQLSEIVSAAGFAEVFEATYLHLQASVDIDASGLQGVEQRVFAKIGPSNAHMVHLYRHGEAWDPGPVADAAAARATLAAGGTVVVNSVQGAVQELAALAGGVTGVLGIHADINMYVTAM
eukprot:gnl/TRDRNA2_/TRDRNA2_166448_c0_seq1.p3 gnl/TRDRNA2_/TRDRNA2_166448_c0~~gnl/TRDRNA2_/TRDRNA2_166448_c0_seq1.p3  ORF type:complete len:189 (-),score=38.68 gnl/TRDRNA2_/TRDRNA2_166448_c0_seq1:926-1492(-)